MAGFGAQSFTRAASKRPAVWALVRDARFGGVPQRLRCTPPRFRVPAPSFLLMRVCCARHRPQVTRSRPAKMLNSLKKKLGRNPDTRPAGSPAATSVASPSTGTPSSDVALPKRERRYVRFLAALALWASPCPLEASLLRGFSRPLLPSHPWLPVFQTVIHHSRRESRGAEGPAAAEGHTNHETRGESCRRPGAGCLLYRSSFVPFPAAPPALSPCIRRIMPWCLCFACCSNCSSKSWSSAA